MNFEAFLNPQYDRYFAKIASNRVSNFIQNSLEAIRNLVNIGVLNVHFGRFWVPLAPRLLPRKRVRNDFSVYTCP